MLQEQAPLLTESDAKWHRNEAKSIAIDHLKKTIGKLTIIHDGGCCCFFEITSFWSKDKKNVTAQVHNMQKLIKAIAAVNSHDSVIEKERVRELLIGAHDKYRDTGGVLEPSIDSIVMVIDTEDRGKHLAESALSLV